MEPNFVLAVDPGNIHSAYVMLEGRRLTRFGKILNLDMRDVIATVHAIGVQAVAIEMVACYGMAVGAEVFETVYWIGRFAEAAEGAGLTVHRRLRKDVKLHHCNSTKAKDGNIRQAIIDRFGGKEAAIGKKKTPGPLHGVAADVWQALALGLMFVDQQAGGNT